MTMKLVPLAAAAALIGGSAAADPFVDAVVQNFRNLGYQFVEIERGATQLKAEGVRGTEELEVVYDLATGRILSQETGRADSRDVGRTGVRIDGATGGSGGTSTPVAVDPARTGDGFADSVIASLRAQGYDFIEIERGATQLKAEGVRGTEELEIVYDIATGQILRQERGRADAEYVGRTGIEFDTSGRDFLGDDDRDDDRDDDDDDRRSDRDDDDDNDDRSGRDRDDDRDDRDDDDRDGGRSGGDDNGGGRSGGDDRGGDDNDDDDNDNDDNGGDRGDDDRDDD